MKKRILSIMLTLAMVLTMTAVLSVGVSAGNAPDYTIVLMGGNAYKNDTDGECITSEVAAMGLSYDSSKATWTMNNFNFTTTAPTAMEISSVTLIVVNGNNSITSGSSSTKRTVGINFANSTVFRGTGSLTVSSGTEDTASTALGVQVTEDNVTVEIEDITFTVNAGDGIDADSYGFYNDDENVTVNVSNANVTFNGGNVSTTFGGRDSVGMFAGATVNVSGKGKLTASGSSVQGDGRVWGITSIHENTQIVAKDANGNTLTWDSTDYAYKDAAGNIPATVILTSINAPEDDPDEPDVPEIVQGDGQTVDVTMVTFATFASDAAASEFVKVTVDGKDVAANYYTLGEETETTVIKLNEAFLATLGNGAHTISIVSASGSADCSFTVAGQSGAAQTGDSSTVALWIALMSISLAAGAFIAFRMKKNAR